ncbi:uncharacterized protein LOC144095562 [Amblyomma americanum]
MNFVVATPKPFFYSAVETGQNRHTAVYVAAEICKVIESLGSDKVVALVTDNASNMQAACSIVASKYEHITCIGCAAHGLNVLLNDLMKLKTLEDVHSTARQVIKYVKRTHIVAATLQEKQESIDGKGRSETLKLPSKTRWGGMVLSLQSLLRNKESLQQTVILSDLKVNKSVRETVLDEDAFWKSVQSCLLLITPIASAITSLESDNALLSDVPEAFHSIRIELAANLATSALTSEEQIRAKEMITRREKLCLRPVHIAANLLDARYRGRHLDDAQIADSFEWISQQAGHLSLDIGKLFSNVAEYRTSAGTWSRTGVWDSAKHVAPSTWWQGLCTNQPLTPLACRLLQIPPSSASCERNWSRFGNVHTRIRNRLSGERVRKLVYVQSNLAVDTTSIPASARSAASSDSDSESHMG